MLLWRQCRIGRAHRGPKSGVQWLLPGLKGQGGQQPLADAQDWCWVRMGGTCLRSRALAPRQADGAWHPQAGAGLRAWRSEGTSCCLSAQMVVGSLNGSRGPGHSSTLRDRVRHVCAQGLRTRMRGAATVSPPVFVDEEAQGAGTRVCRQCRQKAMFGITCVGTIYCPQVGFVC